MALLDTSSNGNVESGTNITTKRKDFPFIKVNGDAIPDDRLHEKISEDGGVSWIFQQDETVTVSQLEIGLRKFLRERIAQEDCIVSVNVHAGERILIVSIVLPVIFWRIFQTGDEISETVILDSTNNFRCSWPHLQEAPIAIEGLSVIFLKQSNPGEEGRPDETSGATFYTNHDRAASDLLCAESISHGPRKTAELFAVTGFKANSNTWQTKAVRN